MKRELTPAEHAALVKAARDFGRTWKQAVRDAWERSDYSAFDHDPTIARLKNTLGPSGLDDYRLDHALTAEDHEALAVFAAGQGSSWKDVLRDCWRSNDFVDLGLTAAYVERLRSLKGRLRSGILRTYVPRKAPPGRTLVEVFAAEEQQRAALARGELDLASPMRSLREVCGVNARAFGAARGVSSATQSEAEGQGARVLLSTLIDAAAAHGKRIKITVEDAGR